MEFTTLTNGVRVVLVPMPGVKSLAVGTYVGTGSRFEEKSKAGISHFIEHLAFKGTNKYPTQQHVSHLEGLGAIQNAATSLDYTSYYCKIPSDKWVEALDVISELTLLPLLPEAEMPAEKKIIIEELKWGKDHPDDLIGDVLQRCLYPGHPLGEPIGGEEETVSNLTRQDLIDYHKSHYVSTNMVVVLAGDIPNLDQVNEAIKSRFSSLKKQDAVDFVPYVDDQTSPRVEIESKSELKQIFIALAVRGLVDSDPRRFTMSVLNSYLGRGFTSRFHQEIREKLGLCYTISSGDNRLSDTGYWGVFAGLNKDRLEEAIKAILNEMKLVTQDLIPEKVLAETKEKIRGPLLFSIENPLHQLDFFGKQVLDRPNEVLDYDAVINRLMMVKAEDVRNLAKELFVTNKLNLAIVGPVEQASKDSLLKLLTI